MTTHTPDDDEKKSFEELTQDLMSFIKKQTGSEAILTFQGPFKIRPEQIQPDNQPAPAEEKKINFNFHYKPQDIKSYLDQFIIQQDEAKKTLSIAICDHFNHVKNCLNKKCKNYHKQNVLMIGPTGVGKTYLIKCIADLIGVPFVRSDATKFTETGYVGGDVEDLVRQLVTKANQNIELAEYGIIYMDEIDKITSAPTRTGRDIGGRGVQSNLLKLMEETEVPLKTPWDINSQMKALFQNKSDQTPETINTKHILFIVSGAFDGLDDMIRKRVEGSKFGFGVDKTTISDDIFSHVSTEDLIKFGLESEFVGRLPVRVVCNRLTENDLFSILKEANGSILLQCQEAFHNYGIEVLFEDSALKKIAKLAYQEKTGARGLGTIFERVFREFKYTLPSTSIKTFIVTGALIDNPTKYLSDLIKNPKKHEALFYMQKITNFETAYFQKFHHHIKFNNEIRKNITTQAQNSNRSVEEICEEMINTLGYQLNRHKNKG